MSDLINLTDQQRVVEQLTTLVTKAERGDEAALAKTRKLFDALPDLSDLHGDLAATAQAAFVNLVAGDKAATRLAISMKMKRMRADLAGPNATPLERLLVERVLACWLQSYHDDLAYADAVRRRSVKEAEFYQRRQDRSARQFLKAMQSLATVRRLLIPVVQVNLAERQINLAGSQVSVVTPTADEGDFGQDIRWPAQPGPGDPLQATGVQRSATTS